MRLIVAGSFLIGTVGTGIGKVVWEVRKLKLRLEQT